MKTLTFKCTLWFSDSYADFTIEATGSYESADREFNQSAGFCVDGYKIIAPNGSEYRGPVSTLNHAAICEAADNAENERHISSMAEDFIFSR